MASGLASKPVRYFLRDTGSNDPKRIVRPALRTTGHPKSGISKPKQGPAWVTCRPIFQDNHKIVCFTPSSDIYHIDGYHHHEKFLDNPIRPVDDLPRSHFRQSLLFNMKGAGEILVKPGPHLAQAACGRPRAVGNLRLRHLAKQCGLGTTIFRVTTVFSTDVHKSPQNATSSEA
ncbi:hypothetical protein HOY80DRAFT_1098092 [Tuber brumale]|nr:hypothetical protein HOY80DRAFT_1098092 [Tuber brumale]